MKKLFCLYTLQNGETSRANLTEEEKNYLYLLMKNFDRNYRKGKDRAVIEPSIYLPDERMRFYFGWEPEVSILSITFFLGRETVNHSFLTCLYATPDSFFAIMMREGFSAEKTQYFADPNEATFHIKGRTIPKALIEVAKGFKKRTGMGL